MMSEQTSVTSHNSDDDDEIGEELLDEFRSLVGSRLSTSSVSSRRRQSSSPMKTAKVLESCLYDLDKQKDVMLQTLTIMEQNSADRIVELGADLTKAQRSAREWEQRSNEVQSRSEDFQQDVHALVNILSLAYHSGQWKFASTDFRTVTSDMLPPTGSSSKEGMRVSLVEKQLSERGRKIQSLQQELVSGSAQHRVLKEQITQRDNELADLRQSLATNQEQLSNALSGLQTHEQEAGTRHTSLMDEVERRDGLLRSLQEENARLQELRSHDVKTSMASGEQLGQLQADVVTLTANLEAEHGRSTELRTQLHTEHQTNEDLKQKLSKQEEQVNGLMERLNSQISELQSNVAVVEDKYKTACSETEEARAQMADHSSSLDSAQADASMYRDQLLDCRAKLEQWETTVTLLRNEHGDEVLRREQTIQDLEVKLQAADTEKWTLSEHVSMQEKTVRRVEEDFNSRLAQHRWQMASKLLALEQQKAQLKTEKQLGAELKLTLQQSERELSETKRQLEAVQSELLEASKTLTSNQEDLGNSLAQFHAEKMAADSSISGLREQLASVQQELNSSASSVVDLEEGNAQLHSALQLSQDTLTACQQQLCEEREHSEELQRFLESTKSKHSLLKVDNDSLVRQLTDRDQLISQLRDQVVGVSDGANEQAKKHSHAYGEVARSLEETITTLRRTQDEVVEKSTSLSRLQAQVSQLESEKTKLLEKGSHSTEEVAKLNISVETLQQENKLCLEQIAKLEDTNTAISAKMTVLQENLNQEQEEVDTLNEAKNSLQASVDRLQEQCMALETAEYDKVELQAEVETLQHQLHVARAELSENETSLEKQHADLVEMEATCARHKDMIQARDEEIERLKESDADEELEQKVQELELQLLDMKDDVSNANCSLQQSQDEAEQWKTTSEANETNLNRFKSECERVRQLLVLKTEELQTAQDQASELERNRTKMLQEVHVERDRATQLQIEVNLLRHHRSEVEESLTRELESLRSHSNYIAKADQLSRELTDAGQELTQLRRSLAAAEEEHDKVIAKLRAEQDQNVKLQARCIAAENSARKSAEAAESSKMEAQNAEQQELQQVKQTSDILTAELTQRQTVIDVLRKEIDDLKVQSRLNVHELKLKRLRVQQIDQDVDAQRIQNSVLREKIMAHERQQTMLEVALEKSQEEREKLSQKITELVSAARHPKANNALSQKASDLEEKVTLLRAALSDSQSEFQSLRQRYGDVQAELEASRQRHAAETSVLEAELNNLRSEQNSADGVHHQLVSQLQTTVNTLGGQLDKVSLQRDEASGDSDDADESHHSLRQSLPFSPAASFLRDVTVAHLESKCSDLESELSASHALRSSVQQYEHQRLQEQQDTFEKEREMLRKSLTVTRDDLKQCRSDLIEKDRQIFKLSRNLEKAESSRQEHLRKVSDIEASVAKLSSPQKSDGDGAG
ncbi:uncharacterized protein LOC135815441 isoform X2 [Sycon ciliatum]|uniref:uncharacterized protein LOC135815441 isoform X2 n=1 Tax=Sycon ciliatum TaxID=27933 RepID=UPI0031F67B1E